MDSATPSGQDDEWELCNDDGFVFKRKKRRLDPDAAAQAAALQLSSSLDLDHEAALKQRRERKRRNLLKLRDKYQREINLWEYLSNTLRTMEERASQLRREQEQAREQTAMLASSSQTTEGTVSVGGSVVDELLLQVEAQEAIIQDVSNLCDVAEAMCHKQEQQFNKSLFDLPIWASPDELMQLLCDD
ncbi:cryptic loci regulator [Senna tora]|uniref:Cryptic loci regulator n=1 Tax=Senna tora TaxID=362788 RepID=A0A834TCY3_9FABA|nr:cryptic loci regulator [Senna tora]